MFKPNKLVIVAVWLSISSDLVFMFGQCLNVKFGNTNFMLKSIRRTLRSLRWTLLEPVGIKMCRLFHVLTIVMFAPARH